MENKVLSLKDLKNLQEDNEIDLSARQLVEVPKPLYLLPRITNVDLGGNKLAFLSNELCTMTRLVKLDLGNNKIHNLPHDFGNLVKLEHLNLFNNEIEELPLSVANLKALKWLDLKKNPLETNLEKAAGNCGNEKECRQAATNVVAFVEKQRSILNSQTEKQKKVLDKIHEKKVIEEQRKGKKGNQKKEDAGSGKSHNHNHEQHAKPKHNSHEKDTKPNSALPRKPSFIGRMLRFFFSSVYYLAIITILLSTVSIGYNCAEGGKQIAGSKPLCADLTKLTQFTKPSDQFISNLRNTYGTVLSNYRKRVVHTTWNLSGIIKENYKSFSRSDIGVAVEKYLYKIHAFVVENALLVKRFVERKWADVTKWYNAEGHKTFGGVVNAVKVGANMAIEVCKDIMVFVRETVVALLARIESFVHIWMEKGFSAAWKTVA